jgi:hypothetical protein
VPRPEQVPQHPPPQLGRGLFAFGGFLEEPQGAKRLAVAEPGELPKEFREKLRAASILRRER